MISKAEIIQHADELEIHHVNVERDYVFGWLLKSIYENDYLRKLLIFKGGNCLRKSYYPDTRFSQDLDFSVTVGIEESVVLAQLNEACRSAMNQCGVEFLVDRNTFQLGPMIDSTRQSYKGRVYFNDFFGNQNDLAISVKLDMTEYDRLLLPAVNRNLIHRYSDASVCQAELTCMAIEEIVASKLKCLIQRRHSHDLFDLVYASFINRSIELDRRLVLQTFLNKTIFSRSPGAAKEILLGIPMTFFSGVWNKFIRCPKGSWFDFKRAEEAYEGSITELFGETIVGSYGERLFFGSSHRNLILDAGRERKLMRIVYDGAEKIIEPYSLAYKTPRNGPSREYFYAYDRTGGRTSGPGIKSLWNTKVDDLEILDETFEPQYEIELSKAGEEARNAYFGKPFNRSDRTKVSSGRRSSMRSTSYTKYKVQCLYCQKTFDRKTRSTTLKPHKSPGGYPCNGRRGHYI